MPYLGCENGYSLYDFESRILQNLAGQKKPGLEARGAYSLEKQLFIYANIIDAENIQLSGSL